MDLRLKKVNNNYVLTDAEGNPKICPYQARILVPGKISGTFGVDVAVCSSQCALFYKSKNFNDVKLCNGVTYENVIETIEKPSQNIGKF